MKGLSLKNLTKMSEVLEKTKLKPVTNTALWANQNGTKVCAVSALLVERGFKVTQEMDGIAPVISKNGHKFKDDITQILIKEYGLDDNTDHDVVDGIIVDFHEKSFKEIAKNLKKNGF